MSLANFVVKYANTPLLLLQFPSSYGPDLNVYESVEPLGLAFREPKSKSERSWTVDQDREILRCLFGLPLLWLKSPEELRAKKSKALGQVQRWTHGGLMVFEEVIREAKIGKAISECVKRAKELFKHYIEIFDLYSELYESEKLVRMMLTPANPRPFLKGQHGEFETRVYYLPADPEGEYVMIHSRNSQGEPPKSPPQALFPGLPKRSEPEPEPGTPPGVHESGSNSDVESDPEEPEKVLQQSESKKRAHEEPEAEPAEEDFPDLNEVVDLTKPEPKETAGEKKKKHRSEMVRLEQVKIERGIKLSDALNSDGEITAWKWAKNGECHCGYDYCGGISKGFPYVTLLCPKKCTLRLGCQRTLMVECKDHKCERRC